MNFVFDNADINVCTVSGYDIWHMMGEIGVSTPASNTVEPKIKRSTKIRPAIELGHFIQIGGTLTLDPATVLASAQERIVREEENEESHTLEVLKGKGIKRGAGRSSLMRGPARRISNQLTMETISLHTLKWLLQRREEQLWTCTDCDDTDTEET